MQEKFAGTHGPARPLAWSAAMKAGLVPKDEFDKPIWATLGRYIARNMLLAFIDEGRLEKIKIHRLVLKTGE